MEAQANRLVTFGEASFPACRIGRPASQSSSPSRSKSSFLRSVPLGACPIGDMVFGQPCWPGFSSLLARAKGRWTGDTELTRGAAGVVEDKCPAACVCEQDFSLTWRGG